MADSKITDLTALTSPAGADVLVIVDSSDVTDDPAGSSRKISVTDLLKEGIEDVLLTANNTMLYRNNSGVAQMLQMAERDTVYRAPSGTIVANNGRNFLDAVLTGDTSGNTTAANYQPHYKKLWNGNATGAEAETYTITWPLNGSLASVVHVFYGKQDLNSAGQIRLPAATAALEGDRVYVWNRRAPDAQAGGIPYITILESTIGALDGDDSQLWRMYNGDFMALQCVHDLDNDNYAWFQCGGTTLENRYEFFRTATGLNFSSGTQYTPGRADVHVTATGQSFTLPNAARRRRYTYEFRMVSGTNGDTATINRRNTDTITAFDDTGNTSVVIGGSASGVDHVKLHTSGDGVWHVLSHSSGVFS